MNQLAAFGRHDLFVSPAGKDTWSGRFAEAIGDATDGPLATIEKARQIVRQRKQAGRLAHPITVWLRGGEYSLGAPLVFTPDDSGPFVYAAYPGEKPVISGGKRIAGFRADKIGGIDVWVASVPEAAAGTWNFRQLIVNGQRRARTRLPRQGYYHMRDVPSVRAEGGGELMAGTDQFHSERGHIQNWKNLQDVEVVAHHFWVDERMPIESFDESTELVKSSRRSMFVLKDDWTGKLARYFVENIFEALSEPGDWYLDRPAGKLYYIPMPGEDIESVEVIAPRLTQLLMLAGKPDELRFVEFLTFRGLTFRHTDPQLPRGGFDPSASPDSARLEYASSPQGAINVPGVIHFEGARNCGIEDCRIQHVGWYGIELSAGCSGNRIVGNELADLGGGGVKIGGSRAREPVARRTGNHRITDNHIYQGGRVFHAGIGVLCTDSFGNSISHNEIHELNYSGIAVGWSWGYDESVSRDNRIEKNHIHHLGSGSLSDMGGIYTLGVSPGTVLRGNLIHDIRKANYGSWCIYLDEGSSHVLVENNVCYRTDSTIFHQHYGRENIVRNNIFCFGGEAIVTLSRAEEHQSFTFERNIVVADGKPLFLLARHCLEARSIFSDLNVLWDITGQPPTSGESAPCNRTHTVQEMAAHGYDRHSVVADPAFADVRNFDFSLRETSPALSLGFRPIDLSDVGPRDPQHRED